VMLYGISRNHRHVVTLNGEIVARCTSNIQDAKPISDQSVH
jgi:hypothetical protein